MLIYSTYRFCTKNSVSAKSELALTDCPTGYDVETWYGVSPNINIHRAFANKMAKFPWKLVLGLTPYHVSTSYPVEQSVSVNSDLALTEFLVQILYVE